MKMLKVIMLCCFLSGAVACEEKLGIVHYTPVSGWTKTLSANVVTFSEMNADTGKYCIITLYGATPGTGNAHSDFVREFNKLVVQPLNAAPNPATRSDSADGWTITAGGAPGDFNGMKTTAFLTVLSQGHTTISILGVFNDERYLSNYVGFIDTMDMDKAAAAAPATGPAAGEAPFYALTMAREFNENQARANQRYKGRRLLVHGPVNHVEVAKDGVGTAGTWIVYFKSNAAGSGMTRCHFNESQAASLAGINVNDDITIEGDCRGHDARAELYFDNCILR